MFNCLAGQWEIPSNSPPVSLPDAFPGCNAWMGMPIMNVCTMNQIIAFLSLSYGEYVVARLNDGLVMSSPHVQVLVVGDPSGCRKAGSACPTE
jgi:hypothetical protein